MLKNAELNDNLHYLYNSPKKLKWKIIANGYDKKGKKKKLSKYEEYDLIFDEKDLRIRGLATPENLKKLKN
jgi:hypothetical protein